MARQRSKGMNLEENIKRAATNSKPEATRVSSAMTEISLKKKLTGRNKVKGRKALLSKILPRERATLHTYCTEMVPLKVDNELTPALFIPEKNRMNNPKTETAAQNRSNVSPHNRHIATTTLDDKIADVPITQQSQAHVSLTEEIWSTKNGQETTEDSQEFAEMFVSLMQTTFREWKNYRVASFFKTLALNLWNGIKLCHTSVSKLKRKESRL